MLLTLWQLLFSLNGRVARSTWWIAGISATVLFVLLLVFLDTQLSRSTSLVLYPPYLWIALALSVKRMRDRGRSPLWLLAAVVPLLGPLWLSVELGCRRGTVGENQYGPDPYDARPDYFTVKTGQAP